MKQDPFSGYRALTPKEMAEKLMNPNIPKTEAEHWAVREIEKQRAEIERLRENVDRAGKEVERADRLRAEIARVKADERKNRAEIVKLRAEIERLRAALSWYADQRNHFPVERRNPGDPDPAVVFVDEPAIMTDWGRRARKALEGKP